jgi:geranylgeranylglycerol-phosphate geranylgeranyltransferase
VITADRLLSVILLLRPTNSLPAAALVLLGAHLTRGSVAAEARYTALDPSLVAALAMFFVTTFGYVSNDLVDLDADRINKPGRPLPSGALSSDAARALVVALALLALATAALLGPVPLLAAAGAILLLHLYNRRLKASPGAGNLMIALLAAAILPVGAVSVGGLHVESLRPVLLPSALLATFILAREALKTVEDERGDQSAGVNTISLAVGGRTVARALVLPAAVTGALVYVLASRYGYSGAFSALVLVGVTLPLLGSALYLWNDASAMRTRRALRLLKASYFAGIAALLLA